MRIVELPEDYALVLQQIEEDGEDDFGELAESLSLDRGRLAHILQALRNKGLISVSRNLQRGAWIRLSSKGKRLVAYVWPESGRRPFYGTGSAHGGT